MVTKVTESDEAIRIVTPELEAAVRKRGYVSGVARQSFLDKKSGFRDAGFGLDIVDWIMEPGSDKAYRERHISLNSLRVQRRPANEGFG